MSERSDVCDFCGCIYGSVESEMICLVSPLEMNFHRFACDESEPQVAPPSSVEEQSSIRLERGRHEQPVAGGDAPLPTVAIGGSATGANPVPDLLHARAPSPGSETGPSSVEESLAARREDGRGDSRTSGRVRSASDMPGASAGGGDLGSEGADWLDRLAEAVRKAADALPDRPLMGEVVACAGIMGMANKLERIAAALRAREDPAMSGERDVVERAEIAMRDVVAEILRLRAENSDILITLTLGGHVRPGDGKACNYVLGDAAICNKCGWTPPKHHPFACLRARVEELEAIAARVTPELFENYCRAEDDKMPAVEDHVCYGGVMFEVRSILNALRLAREGG